MKSPDQLLVAELTSLVSELHRRSPPNWSDGDSDLTSYAALLTASAEAVRELSELRDGRQGHVT